MTLTDEAKELLGGHFDNFIQYSKFVYTRYKYLLNKKFHTTFSKSELEQRQDCLEEITTSTSVTLESILYGQQDLLANTIMNVVWFNKGKFNKHQLFNIYKNIKKFSFNGYWENSEYIRISV